MLKISSLIVFISFLFFGALQSHAVTLNVDGGLLAGASGVEVNGENYDVMFMDGSCDSLFNNCNPDSFIFNTQVSAVLAAQTLLDTVLIDAVGVGNFDTEQETVRGCTTGTQECSILTPYFTDGTNVTSAFTLNNSSVIFDETLPGTSPGIFLNNEIPGDGISLDITYAIWKTPTPGTGNTPAVPEPSTILMLSTGLLGLAGYQWQKRLRDKEREQN